MADAERRLGEQTVEGVHHEVDGPGLVDHHTGLAVDHRLGRIRPLSPATCGDAGGGRLQEHDAEPLLLEAGPPGAAEHGEHVGAPYSGRQVGVGHATEQPYRRADRLDEAFEPGRVAAAATDGDLQARVTIGAGGPRRGSARPCPCGARGG